MKKVKQKQRCPGGLKVNTEFKNLVRRLKRLPLTTGWHCIDVFHGPPSLVGLDTPKSDVFPERHSKLLPVGLTWWWVASDPAYKLWTKYNQQYKAWCKIK